MHISNWLVFSSVALLTTFSPGPAVLLAISNSVTAGPRRALIGALGNALGLFLLSGISMAGLGMLLSASASAFTALKLAGAAYLIFLGVKQWRNQTSAFAAENTLPTAGTRLRLFSQGISVALTNPKALLFFSALFPQFLVPGISLVSQFMLLTSTFCACALLSHTSYVFLAHTLSAQLGSYRRIRWFNRASGGLFILLGLSLLRLPRAHG